MALSVWARAGHPTFDARQSHEILFYSTEFRSAVFVHLASCRIGTGAVGEGSGATGT
jgi:hypothetical protein